MKLHELRHILNSLPEDQGELPVFWSAAGEGTAVGVVVTITQCTLPGELPCVLLMECFGPIPTGVITTLVEPSPNHDFGRLMRGEEN